MILRKYHTPRKDPNLNPAYRKPDAVPIEIDEQTRIKEKRIA